MIKVAILDDYQNISQEFVDLKKLSGKYEIKVFSEPFVDDEDAINDAKCRYRLSVGPSFEYQIANGRVSTLTK